MRRIKITSLRTYLLLLTVLAMAPMFVLTLFNAAEQRTLSAQRVQDNALQLADRAIDSHRQLIEGAHQVLIVLSHLSVVRDDDAEACNAVFADLLRQYPYYANLAVLKPNGDVFCSGVPLASPVNSADRAWFQHTIRTRAFTISDYQVGRITNKPAVFVAYPVLSEAGEIQGVVTLSIDVGWLNQLLATTSSPPGSTLTAFDRSGTVLARYPDPEAWSGKAAQQTPLFAAIRSKGAAGTVIVQDLDGQTRLFGFGTLSNSDGDAAVSLAVGIPAASAFAEVDRSLHRNLLVLGLFTFMGLATAWLMAENVIVQRVRGLISAAVRLGEGDLTARSGQNYRAGELGMLARAFDGIAAALENQDAARRGAESALLDALKRLQILNSIVSKSPTVAFLWATGGNWPVEFVSDSIAQFGYAPEDFLSHRLTYQDIIYPDDLDRIADETARHKEIMQEYRIVTASGQVRWVDDRTFIQRDAQGKVTHYQGIIVDITERKRAEEALQESERTAHAMLDATSDSVFLVDRQGTILMLNEAAARGLGKSMRQCVGTNAWQQVCLDQSGKEGKRFDDLFSSGKPSWFEAVRAGLWHEHTIYPIMNVDGVVDRVVVYVRDITERKRASEELRALTVRLAETEEAERRRLAQELHDRVGQNLTALSINLSIMSNLLPPKSSAAIMPRLEDSLALVGETVEHIRDVMAELRPPVLDDYGLLASLRWFGHRFAQRAGLAITIGGAEPSIRLPLATEIILFRIAQEALTNVARHAEAHQVSIMLEEMNGGARLTIADDGIGFDPEKRSQPNNRRGLGLLTMAERAESIGGRLRIDSAPGRGTRVIVEVGGVS